MPPAEPPCRADAGFTLLEVIVVLAVLGLLGGLVLGRGAPRSAALELRAAAGSVAGSLRLARSRAIAGNQVVTAVPGVADGNGRPLPQGVSVTVAVPRGQPPGRITFLPDGSATGGVVALAAGTLSARVAVDWLSGAVTVTGAR